MIKFNLKCPSDHQFEAWFRDGDTYEQQAERGEVLCPVCADTHISKAPMAPRIARHGVGEAVAERRARIEAALKQQLMAMRETVEQNCDYVGDRFPEEARRIHFGETEKRNIYGEANEEEARALEEDGVTFARIPWVGRTDS